MVDHNLSVFACPSVIPSCTCENHEHWEEHHCHCGRFPSLSIIWSSAHHLQGNFAMNLILAVALEDRLHIKNLMQGMQDYKAFRYKHSCIPRLKNQLRLWNSPLCLFVNAQCMMEHTFKQEGQCMAVQGIYDIFERILDIPGMDLASILIFFKPLPTLAINAIFSSYTLEILRLILWCWFCRSPFRFFWWKTVWTVRSLVQQMLQEKSIMIFLFPFAFHWLWESILLAKLLVLEQDRT